jgi:hypothetical protein
MQNDSWPWWKVLLIWSAIGFGILYSGSLAVRASMAMRAGSSDFGCSFWQAVFVSCPFSQVLLLFSVGGGVTIGLLILVWWMVTKRGFSWTLGFVVLGIMLVALFVWPTPYRYEWAKDKSFVVKINRFSGMVEYKSRP